MLKLNDLPAASLGAVDPELVDDLRLVFRHEPGHDKSEIAITRRVSGERLLTGRRTEARVVSRNPSGAVVTLLSAWSRCNPSDQFCYETGRRVALRRMIWIYKATHLHGLAAAVLQRYFNRPRGAFQLGALLEIRKPDGSSIVAGDLKDGDEVVIVPKGSHYALVGQPDNSQESP